MKGNKMKRVSGQTAIKAPAYLVTQRLDESLPLHTAEWQKVEQMLMRLSEFAPSELITELVDSIASWADDQARRGYLLGQEDLLKEMKQRSVA